VKKFRLLVVLLLATILLFGVTPAYADDDDDGTTVDIIVIGDNSDVGLGVIGNDTQTEVNTQGENAKVIVNGRSVAAMLADAARDHGSSFTVVIDKWSRWRIEEVIFPWMVTRDKVVDLLTDGLAKNIVLTTDRWTGNLALLDRINKLEERVQDAETFTERFEALQTRLDEGLATRQEVLKSEHQILVSYINAKVDAIQREYDQKIFRLLMVFSSLIVILMIMCACLGLRRTKWV